MTKFNYDSYMGDYQHNALANGHWFQKFWHKGKLQIIDTITEVKNDDLILDFGCGSGNLCFHLAEKCAKIFGIDTKKDAISFAKNLNLQKSNKCTFFEMTTDKLPFDDCYFDKVFLLDVIEHIENPKDVLTEINRVIKEKGQLIITTPNYNSFWPVLEFFTDLFHISPDNGKQHVTRLTKTKCNKLVNECKFVTQKSGTAYLFSPFFSFSNVAYKMLNWEIQTASKGMLIYAVAYKI